MNHEPKGRAKKLLDAMQAEPSHTVWTVPQAARAMGVKNSEVMAYVLGMVKAERLYRSRREGAVVLSLAPFSGKPAKPKWEPKPIPQWNPEGDPRVPRVVAGWKPPVMVPPRGI